MVKILLPHPLSLLLPFSFPPPLLFPFSFLSLPLLLLSLVPGKVLPSILLTHGVHCRLEDICPETDCWLRDVSFVYNGKPYFRKQGDRVHPAIMPGWRALRKSDPELFTHMRVWQQPAASTDSVIWRWQLELEASEYRQAVRVTDCLGSVWSKPSKEAAYLLQQLNCPVAPGCTPLQQPTDTHLAKPAKDAGRAEKERLREVMRLAAAKLGLPVQYKSTKREILLVALAMDARMRELNAETQAVLQACFAGGWFAWRPGPDGSLHRTSEELWAQQFAQAAGRVSADQLASRYDWLDSSGKPTMPDLSKPKDWQQEAETDLIHNPDPQAQPEEDCLDLETEPVYLDDEEELQSALAALLHPSSRSDAALEKEVESLGWYKEVVKQRLAEEQKKKKAAEAGKAKLAKSATQKGQKKQKGRKEARELRSVLACRFREKMEQAGGAEKRLAELLPASDGKAKQPGKAGKAARKAKKKNLKKQVLAQLGKLGKSAAWKKRKEDKKKKARSLASAAASAQAGGLIGQEGGPLTGQKVRLVSFELPELLRNSPATVQTHWSTGLVVVVAVTGNTRGFREHEVYQLTGSEKLPMAEKLGNLKSGMTKDHKLAVFQACGGELRKKVTAKDLLESPELSAAWHELGWRAKEAGDPWPNPFAVCLNVQELSHALDQWHHSPGSSESQNCLTRIRMICRPVVAHPEERAFIQLPVHAGGHWTLLTFLRRSPGAKLELIYRDSLWQLHQACQLRAQTALGLMKEVVGVDNLAQQALPALTPSGVQADATSCGFWVMKSWEEDYRWLRGEGVYRLAHSFGTKAHDLSRWNDLIMAAKARAAPKAKPQAEPLAAPLPAPSAPAASSADLVPLPPPPAPVAHTSNWGCSKCRHSKAGCRLCNPEKMAKYAAQQGDLAALALPAAKRKRQG